MMREYLKFYIGGRWIDPAQSQTFDVVNPATEEVCGKVAASSAADVDKAVAAARGAFMRLVHDQCRGAGRGTPERPGRVPEARRLTSRPR